MKTLLLSILSTAILSAFCYQNRGAKMPSISCVLTSDKTVYKPGEVPKLEVRIKNNGNSDICLIRSLDNSDIKRRMPYCYYTIDKPKPDTVMFGRCGTSDPLKVEDFRMVKAGEVFNPYEKTTDHGFSPDYASTQKETFKNPGVYKIQFHYAVNADDITRFVGSISMENLAKRSDTTVLKTLFAQVPKIALVSNSIEIKIEE